MFHHFFILCLFFLFALKFNDASKFSLKKPRSWAAVKRSVFWTSNSKLAADSTQEEIITMNPLLSSLHLELKHRSLDSLADSILQIILEHFIDDYKTMRLVSKNFRKAFDDLIYSTCWIMFPGFTKETFSYWNNEYLKYQLILLLRVFSSNIKSLMECYEKSETRLDLTTNYHLRLNAVRFITLVASENWSCGLKSANLFLKLGLVTWAGIYDFFWNRYDIFHACSLGLTTIAREMATFDSEAFLESVGSRDGGLLKAVQARKYDLSRFIIHFMRSQSHQFKNEERIYLNTLISDLIDAKYWDLLQILSEMNEKYIDCTHSTKIAKLGSIEGLRALRSVAKDRYYEMILVAAEKGHSAFLREMDTFGLLQKVCCPAIRAAASNGRTECLEFLVNRFGTECLAYKSPDGFMPIHVAARSKNPETLRAIIRLYPLYEPKSYFFFNSSESEVKSPLLEAVWYNLPDNAKTLLEHFPELIYVNDSCNNTVIHLAMRISDARMLRVLLEYAPPEVITARANDGNCALHVGTFHSNYTEKRTLLMNTGLFSGMERNNSGLTPPSK